MIDTAMARNGSGVLPRFHPTSRPPQPAPMSALTAVNNAIRHWVAKFGTRQWFTSRALQIVAEANISQDEVEQALQVMVRLGDIKRIPSSSINPLYMMLQQAA